jgi:hypothetical protein
MRTPNFWQSFGEALALSAQRRGIRAYIPWFLMLILALGLTLTVAALFLRAKVSNPDTIAALSAMLVTAGFLGAVSVGCMNQIFSTLTDQHFSEYLRTISAFDQFIAWPQLTLLIQMSYLFLCAMGIIAICIFDENIVRAIALCMLGALSIYVTNKTWKLVDLLRILAWHRQDFAQQLEAALHDANGT